MICNATITSVRAYGFCPIASPNTTVEMHLIVTRWSERGRVSSDVYIEAECNSTISDNFTKGYVTGENLNISVTIGDFVAVKYFQSCSKKRCHFHPAFTRRKGSDSPAALVTNSSITTSKNYSILLCIVMKKTGMYHESLY